MKNSEEVEREEVFVERRCDFGSGEGREGVEDSEEANGGFDRAVTERVDEREEEGRDRVFREMEEELLGEGERGGADRRCGGGGDCVF